MPARASWSTGGCACRCRAPGSAHSQAELGDAADADGAGAGSSGYAQEGRRHAQAGEQGPSHQETRCCRQQGCAGGRAEEAGRKGHQSRNNATSSIAATTTSAARCLHRFRRLGVGREAGWVWRGQVHQGVCGGPDHVPSGLRPHQDHRRRVGLALGQVTLPPRRQTAADGGVLLRHRALRGAGLADRPAARVGSRRAAAPLLP